MLIRGLEAWGRSRGACKKPTKPLVSFRFCTYPSFLTFLVAIISVMCGYWGPSQAIVTNLRRISHDRPRTPCRHQRKAVRARDERMRCRMLSRTVRTVAVEAEITRRQVREIDGVEESQRTAAGLHVGLGHGWFLGELQVKRLGKR